MLEESQEQAGLKVRQNGQGRLDVTMLARQVNQPLGGDLEGELEKFLQIRSSIFRRPEPQSDLLLFDVPLRLTLENQRADFLLGELSFFVTPLQDIEGTSQSAQTRTVHQGHAGCEQMQDQIVWCCLFGRGRRWGFSGAGHACIS